jgi:hypothetical protein
MNFRVQPGLTFTKTIDATQINMYASFSLISTTLKKSVSITLFWCLVTFIVLVSVFLAKPASVFLWLARSDVWIDSERDTPGFATAIASRLMDNNQPGYRIIIVGSSFTEKGIGNPSYLQQIIQEKTDQKGETYLLASSSQKLLQTQSLVDAATRQRGAIVLMGVSELKLGNTEEQLALYNIGVPPSSGNSSCTKPLCELRVLPYFANRLTPAVKNLLLGHIPEQQYGYTFETDPSQRKPRKITWKWQKFKSRFQAANIENAPFISQIKTFLNRYSDMDNLQIIVFLEPLHPKFLHDPDISEKLFRARKILKETVTQQGIIFLNDLRGLEIQGQSFFDFGHIADQTQRMRIAQVLAPYIVSALSVQGNRR